MTEFTMDDAVYTVIFGAAFIIAVVGMKQNIDQQKLERDQNKNTTEIKTQYIQKQDSIISYL